MTTVNMHEAKTNFSKLVARVEAGEDVVIARNAKPVAKLVAFAPSPEERIAGRDRGVFEVPDDFDAPLPTDVLAGFEG
jgi:prevent-host-death family protein